jgi:hypothetical protein
MRRRGRTLRVLFVWPRIIFPDSVWPESGRHDVSLAEKVIVEDFARFYEVTQRQRCEVTARLEQSVHDAYL